MSLGLIKMIRNWHPQAKQMQQDKTNPTALQQNFKMLWSCVGLCITIGLIGGLCLALPVVKFLFTKGGRVFLLLFGVLNAALPFITVSYFENMIIPVETEISTSPAAVWLWQGGLSKAAVVASNFGFLSFSVAVGLFASFCVRRGLFSRIAHLADREGVLLLASRLLPASISVENKIFSGIIESAFSTAS